MTIHAAESPGREEGQTGRKAEGHLRRASRPRHVGRQLFAVGRVENRDGGLRDARRRGHRRADGSADRPWQVCGASQLPVNADLIAH